VRDGGDCGGGDLRRGAPVSWLVCLYKPWPQRIFVAGVFTRTVKRNVLTVFATHSLKRIVLHLQIDYEYVTGRRSSFFFLFCSSTYRFSNFQNRQVSLKEI
jgi:hypothetical protein